MYKFSVKLIVLTSMFLLSNHLFADIVAEELWEAGKVSYLRNSDLHPGSIWIKNEELNKNDEVTKEKVVAMRFYLDDQGEVQMSMESNLRARLMMQSRRDSKGAPNIFNMELTEMTLSIIEEGNNKQVEGLIPVALASVEANGIVYFNEENHLPVLVDIIWSDDEKKVKGPMMISYGLDSEGLWVPLEVIQINEARTGLFSNKRNRITMTFSNYFIAN